MRFLSPQRMGLGVLSAASIAALWVPVPLSAAASARAAVSRPPSEHAQGHGLVAIRAGTLHLVESGKVLRGGATILVQDGKIRAAGKDVKVPVDARVVDYGSDAVIVPGLVAAAGYAHTRGNNRSAQPALRAIEDFDFTGDFASTLAAGVTSLYVSAAENRLIGGKGALVKLAGDDEKTRTLRAEAVLQVAIDSSARHTPGFWAPPIPATVDVGLGYGKKELPHTTMGAIVALEELLAEAGTGAEKESPYGPHAGLELKKALDAKLPWRLAATSGSEIRAALSFAGAHHLHLILDRAFGAGKLAAPIAKAGADVIWRFPLQPVPGHGRDWGKDEDARWPDYTVPAALQAAGVRFAIAPPAPRDVLFAAAAASAGGLSAEAALRAVTLSAAEIFGVEDRIGSITPGKDADLVVLNGEPISGRASVLATWVQGKIVWKPTAPVAAEGKGPGPKVSTATVLAVKDLYVGDGEVLHGGELLIVDGKIREIGERVSRPLGASVLHAAAAMPGIVDALGYLGLEGSKKSVTVDYDLSQIMAPGDALDRRVAGAGITTVALSPRSTSRGGSPLLAYKPAAVDFKAQVLSDQVAVRVNWTDRNRAKSGQELRALLVKASTYKKKWEEYEKALAAWTPPEPTAASEETKAEKEGKETKDSEAKADEKEKSEKEGKKKNHKKGEKAELEPDPLSGVWEAQVTTKPEKEDGEEGSLLRLRLHLVPEEGSGKVQGNLRSDLVSTTLVELEGTWDREAKSLGLMGLGSAGWVNAVLTLEEGKLTGSVNGASGELVVSADRKSSEWVVAGRSREVAQKKQKASTPKGKPKSPRSDARLEPFKEVLEGKAALLVNVNRADEILNCVAALEKYGVRPILVGASDAYKVASQLVGRVSGVLLSQGVVVHQAERGTSLLTPWSDLQNAGIRVAFYSGAEEGAIDLPILAAYAVANGMSPEGALRALTADAADMLAIGARVGRLKVGLDGDVLLLDGLPLAPRTRVEKTFVNGREVH